MAARPLYYTFGNHMHWADFAWLWGYHVLPDSTRDMLRFCREAGVRGNVNYDGFGYERMAAECPAVLSELREAVAEGTLEPVWGSWGQPYGLFQGGESNVRQLALGVRSVLRHLGVRPRGFWEEEFYFFPQLPQILAGCGYTGACLFFQWTWHTPELPVEEHAAIRWEGLDGTRLPALPRNGLCVHQWPEDFAPILASPLLDSLENPALVQWIEVLPSPDWMCRSELLLPEMKALAGDPRFELRPRTLSALIEELDDGQAPVRRYGMDDVWHGLTLGKNADFIPRASARVEATLLAAESIACLVGLLGRPYASWDVHPTWELDEAWRELLLAQHHDNHECEGLCGFIGHDQFDRAERMARRVRRRSLHALARRLDPARGKWVVANPLGWERDVFLGADLGVAPAVPPFGYRQLGEPELRAAAGEPAVRFERPEPRRLEVESDGWSGGIDLAANLVRDGATVDLLGSAARDAGDHLLLEARAHPHLPVVELSITADHLQAWDPGVEAALALELAPDPLPPILLHDHPYGTGEVRASADRQRKYPSGDWMTSEQWFETVRRPFTALQLLDWVGEDGRGLLVLHDGSQSWQRTDCGARVVLNAIDPWDEEYRRSRLEARLWLAPHGPLPHVERHRLAAELRAEVDCARVPPPGGLVAAVGGGSLEGVEPLPVRFSAAAIEGGALLTAFHREGARMGEGLPDWAGHGMAAPHVLRVVEYEGVSATATLRLAGGVSTAWRTDLLGEKVAPLEVRRAGGKSELEVSLRPHEIATVMVDLDLGRREPRDLDARRGVWASVHRTGEHAS